MKMKKNLGLVAALSLACVLVLAGCKNDPPAPAGLELDTDAMVRTEYTIGESFSPDGLKATLRMSDGSRKAVSADALRYEMDNGAILTRTRAFTAADAGLRRVTASYAGLEAKGITFVVEALSVSAVEISQEPKTVYDSASPLLDLTGLRLLVRMSDGSVRYEDWSPSSGILTIPAHGERIQADTSVTVVYREKTTSFGVTYTEAVRTPTGISVKTLPTRQSYVAGEAFNPSGLSLTVSYDDALGDGTLAYSADSGMTFHGESLGDLVPGQTVITQDDTVTVTYKGLAATFGISYEAPVKMVTAVSIEDKGSYEAAYTANLSAGAYEYPSSVLRLTVRYSDGSVEEHVQVTEAMFNGNVDLKREGRYTVTITYVPGITTSYTVTVTAAPVTPATLMSISIVDKDSTYAGRRHLAGSFAYPVGTMVIERQYDKGANTTIATTDAHFAENDLQDLNVAGTHTVTVAYTENGVTKRASYGITTVAPPVADKENGATVSYGTKLKYDGMDDGMEIRYTTDGTTEPTKESGSQYDATAGIEVDRNMTVKARVYLADGGTKTEADLPDVGLKAQLPSPTVTEETVPYGNAVFLNGILEGARAYYTTDGSVPSDGSALYDASAGIVADHDLDVRAVMAMDGCETSAPGDAVRINARLPMPELDGDVSDLKYGDAIKLKSTVQGVTIRYTMDGSDPTVESEQYNDSGIMVSEGMQIRAKAFKDGCTTSGAFSLDGLTVTLPAPTSVTQNGETLPYGTMVRLSGGAEGVRIMYTTDGTEPTEGHGTEYDAVLGITVDRNMTIRAKAFKEGYSESPELTVSGLKAKMAKPTSTTLPNTVFQYQADGNASSEKVAVTDVSSNGTVRYTTDGSEPTGSSPKYPSGGLFVEKTMTVRAKSFKDGCEPSDMFVLDVRAKLPTVTSTSAQGAVFQYQANGDPSDVKLALANPVSDTRIFYTTNNSTPGLGSTEYDSGGITVERNMTVKARAFKDDMDPSDVFELTVKAKLPSPALGDTSQGQVFQYRADGQPSSDKARIGYSSVGSAKVQYMTSSGQEWTDYPGQGVEVDRNMTITAKMVARNAGQFEDSDEFELSVKAKLPAITSVTGRDTVFQYRADGQPAAEKAQLANSVGSVEIRYTTDNSVPTESSHQYSDGVEVDRNMTIKARAFRSGLEPSEVFELPVKAKLPSPRQGATVPGKVFQYQADGRPAAEKAQVGYASVSGAKVQYRTGSDQAWEDYTSGVEVDRNMTVMTKMVAETAGTFEDSEVFNLPVKAKLPVPTSGQAPNATLAYGTVVPVSGHVDGVTIRYTADNSEPTTDSADGTSGVPITKAMNLSLRSFRADCEPSETLVINGLKVKALPPTAPNGSVVEYQEDGQPGNLVLSTMEGTVIYYTVNGEEPTLLGGTRYEGPIVVRENMRVKARAMGESLEFSDTLTVDAKVKLPLSTQGSTVEGQVFQYQADGKPSAVKAQLANGVSGAQVRYTTDDTDPTTNSPLFPDGGIIVDRHMTIKAKAFKTGFLESDTFTLNVQAQLPAPTVNLYEQGTTKTYSSRMADVVFKGPTTTIPGAEIQYRTKLGENGDFTEWVAINEGGKIPHNGSQILHIEARLVNGELLDSTVTETTLTPQWNNGQSGPNGGIVWANSTRGEYLEVTSIANNRQIRPGSYEVREGWQDFGEGWLDIPALEQVPMNQRATALEGQYPGSGTVISQIMRDRTQSYSDDQVSCEIYIGNGLEMLRSRPVYLAVSNLDCYRTYKGYLENREVGQKRIDSGAPQYGVKTVLAGHLSNEIEFTSTIWNIKTLYIRLEQRPF